MKKTMLAAVIALSAFTAAQAQTKQSKISLGPSAGFGHSWISNSGTDLKFKPYGNVGASFIYSATPHFGIGIDAKYSFEGAKAKSGSSLDLDYIRIPVKAIYFFNELGSKIRPKLFAGPSLGFLTSAKAGDVSVKDNYRGFDFGVTGGAGLNIRLVDRTWFNADLTYNHGLTKIADGSDSKNRNLGLNVGVNFGL